MFTNQQPKRCKRQSLRMEKDFFYVISKITAKKWCKLGSSAANRVGVQKLAEKMLGLVLRMQNEFVLRLSVTFGKFHQVVLPNFDRRL